MEVAGELMMKQINNVILQLSYGFTHTWNIRNHTEDQRGRDGKLKGGMREGDKP